MKVKTKIGIAIAAVIVVLVVALGAVSNYLVDYAIGRSGDGGDREVSLEVEQTPEGVEAVIAANRATFEKQTEDFLAANPGEAVETTSDDGLTLRGVCYTHNEAVDSHRWAIALHGYRANHTGALQLAAPYYEAGYNVLTPDLRACGDSEGNFVGMGWLDRKDVLRWIDYIIQRDPDAEIVIHGISMGAATTMMTAGEDTPDNVKAFVEDCGYTSVWDEFAAQLKDQFGLPSFPLMNTTSALCQYRYGWSFAEAQQIEQVRKSTKPMLFIHGDKDAFVPYAMLHPLYEAKTKGRKAIFIAKGSVHAMAYRDHHEEYTRIVRDFVSKEE